MHCVGTDGDIDIVRRIHGPASTAFGPKRAPQEIEEGDYAGGGGAGACGGGGGEVC